MTAPIPAAAARAVSLLESMLTIRSPSGEEARLAAHLEVQASALGLTASRDAVGNFIAEGGRPGGPTLMLLGHLDTAPDADPLPKRRVGERLYGRGAVDAKGPLAAMICAAAAVAPRLAGRVVVAGVVEEETPGSRGARHLVASHARPDALVIGEPSGWSNVVLGYKGQLSLTYHVRRQPTHPTNPSEKATDAAVAFWQELRRIVGDAAQPSFHQPSATLLRFAGDMAEATLEIDLRTPPGFAARELVDRLREASAGGAVTIRSQVEAVRVERRDPVVRALSAAIRAHGGAPGHRLKTATSDMNTVAPHWPVPMATYGPGDSALDHAPDEHIEIDHYLRAIAVLEAALDDLAREARP